MTTRRASTASAASTATADAAPAAFVPRSATRAKGTYLAANTPAEFFADPKFMLKLTEDIGRRFARCASFVRADDFAQNAAVVVLECARRWKPESGVQFGGYAFRSAELWCTGAMHRASVPVSGPLDSRAVVSSIMYSSLDEQVGDGESTTTLGAVLGWEQTATGITHRPDANLDRDDDVVRTTLRGVLSHYPIEVQDALIGVLAGDPPEAGETLPDGYTAEGLVREADRLRVALQHALEAAGVSVPGAAEASEQEDALDPWLSGRTGRA